MPDPIEAAASDPALSSDLVDLGAVDFRRVAQLPGSAMARSLLRIQAFRDAVRPANTEGASDVSG